MEEIQTNANTNMEQIQTNANTNRKYQFKGGQTQTNMRGKVVFIRTHCWTQIPWTLSTLLTVDRLTLSQIDLLPMSLDEDKKHAKTVKYRQKKTKSRKQKTSALNTL